MKAPHSLLPLLLALALAACTGGGAGDDASARRGVYHWKTTYAPTAWERQWMADHHVGRLYVKLFEVDAGSKHGYDDWRMVPVATTRFDHPLPADLDVVPVVYITVDAIRTLGQWDWAARDRYASLLVERVYAMMGEHYGGEVHEVQLDCDWTQSTRETFFAFARAVKGELQAHGALLGGTVRLHQLSDDGIPFDRKLLMCYNTGRLQDPTTLNSILDYHDAKPYLDGLGDTLAGYDVAWPAYGWGVRFDEKGAFLQLTAPQRAERTRVEWGELRAITLVRRALPPMQEPTTVLFHLDSANLAHYRFEEIEAMFGKQ